MLLFFGVSVPLVVTAKLPKQYAKNYYLGTQMYEKILKNKTNMPVFLFRPTGGAPPSGSSPPDPKLAPHRTHPSALSRQPQVRPFNRTFPPNRKRPTSTGPLAPVRFPPLRLGHLSGFHPLLRTSDAVPTAPEYPTQGRQTPFRLHPNTPSGNAKPHFQPYPNTLARRKQWLALRRTHPSDRSRTSALGACPISAPLPCAPVRLRISTS